MLHFKLNTIYIRLYTDKVILRHLEKEITINRTAVNKFSNPRMLLADFRNAQALIRDILDEIYSRKRITPSFKVLLQPMEKLEGGISSVERCSYNDLAMHIGAKYVYIHETQEILDDSLVKELIR